MVRIWKRNKNLATFLVQLGSKGEICVDIFDCFDEKWTCWKKEKDQLFDYSTEIFHQKLKSFLNDKNRNVWRKVFFSFIWDKKTWIDHIFIIWIEAISSSILFEEDYSYIERSLSKLDFFWLKIFIKLRMNTFQSRITISI
jgi:hypothetical protein